MKAILYIFLGLLAGVYSCQNQAGGDKNHQPVNISISVDDFDKKLSIKDIQLIDVRTPEEFNQGHLQGALNFNINSGKFTDQLTKLDKNKAVLVYCLSGGRSFSAAELMAAQGFKEIYNMQGGIMKWSNNNKPLVTNQETKVSQGLTIEDFTKLVRSDKLVLVDYNAKWCKPCIKMAPILEAFTDKRKDRIVLVKIDADENKNLLKKKGIESLPVLELYKDGKILWRHQGEIDEEKLVNEIKL